MKEPKQMTTVELVTTMDDIDKEVNELVKNYEMCKKELNNRFPFVEGNKEFDLTVFKVPDEDIKLYKIGGINNGKKDRR